MKPVVRLFVDLVLLFFVSSVLCYCSGLERRTKLSDERLTVSIDHSNVSTEAVASLERAILEDGRFNVVSRESGFRASMREQNLEWDTDTSDRFNRGTAYARKGDLVGIGGIFVPKGDCYWGKTFWGSVTRDCTITLSLVDTKTAEVIATARTSGQFKMTEFLPWDELVKEIGDKYPEYFEEVKKTERLRKVEHENKLQSILESNDPDRDDKYVDELVKGE